MPRYLVNATISMSAWAYCDADTPEEAVAEVQASYSPSDFEYDDGTADVEYNVDPAWELA